MDKFSTKLRPCNHPICVNTNLAQGNPVFTQSRSPGPSKSTPPRTLRQASQNSQTYQNRKMTAAKNPSHTLHPTPVRSAIRSILFIVPRNRTRVLSNVSFILSARAEESRISSPMATVICSAHTARQRALVLRMSFIRVSVAGGTPYVFQHLHFRTHAFELCVILALELGQDGVAVMSSVKPTPAHLRVSQRS